MRSATTAKLRANATTIRQLGRRHGLHSFALSTEPGKLVATLDADRSYFDITSFESDLSSILGALAEVVPRGPGVEVEETKPLNDLRGAACPTHALTGKTGSCYA